MMVGVHVPIYNAPVHVCLCGITVSNNTYLVQLPPANILLVAGFIIEIYITDVQLVTTSVIGTSSFKEFVSGATCVCVHLYHLSCGNM